MCNERRAVLLWLSRPRAEAMQSSPTASFSKTVVVTGHGDWNGLRVCGTKMTSLDSCEEVHQLYFLLISIEEADVEKKSFADVKYRKSLSMASNRIYTPHSGTHVLKHEFRVHPTRFSNVRIQNKC
jgi:hypothetical protein